ncbi:hypothetical protein QYE76_018492 [Lolium multiflorum]|uniref:Uncharacterized protein n=1 Tax=Lolium multiflorum TaxID=4521 RepID=A0AAD8UWW9_LOLMU|nr:hypothetical protein QYE76_018492 [Lolium multiflorum]
MKEVQDRLQEELQAEKDLRELEKKCNDALQYVKETQEKIIKDLDEQVWKTFPESQDRAIEAITEARRDDPLPNPGRWTTTDHLTALSVQVSYIDKLGKYLPGAAIRTFANLWSEEKIPDRVEVIASHLMESGSRLTEWRRSSACSEADTALKFLCSWYEGVDLDALATLRLGAPTTTDPALTINIWVFYNDFSSSANVQNASPTRDPDGLQDRGGPRVTDGHTDG